jgi:heat-inducible transcriptional repressor
MGWCMVDLTLSQRSRQILEAIVEDYIATAEPVGSSAVAKRHSLALSSATVRNVMASLEELGLLVSPHTSAGRIPYRQGLSAFMLIPWSVCAQSALEKNAKY